MTTFSSTRARFVSTRQDRRLARDLVGSPKPPKVGLCQFCGAVASGLSVCEAHSDLTELDPATCGVVTTNTTAACSQTLGRGTREQAAEGA